MHVATARFGTVEFDRDEIIYFQGGILGMESCRSWVLLADAENDVLGWLQSTQRGEVALAIVSPRRFVADYQIRVSRRDLEALQIEKLEDLQALVTVAQGESGCTLNLKAPLIFNVARRLGAQVVAKDDLPLQFEVPSHPTRLKKSA